ncbi:MAG: hypothetical protein U5L95_02490 [Candidatus Saccharibacteria bacterium]|nr:hypothetical protein [Candidatus Saccharibacteria bacterium]
MTTKDEIKKLEQDGWVVTDPSCNQMRKEIIEDKTYAFREDRCIDPLTGETEVFEQEMDYDDYSYREILDACMAYGYTMKQIDKWITEGEEIELMLECVFELEV